MLLGLFYIEEIGETDLYAVFPITQFSTNKIQFVSTIMLSRLSLKGESSENKKKEQKKKTKKRKRLKNEDVEEEEFLVNFLLRTSCMIANEHILNLFNCPYLLLSFIILIASVPKLLTKWDQVLKDNSSNISLWIQYLDFRQTNLVSFTVTQCLQV